MMPDSFTRPEPSRADELNIVGAKLHTEKGQVELARLHYLAALTHDPNHIQALQNLGAALLAMNKNEAAASVSRRCVAIDPKAWGAWGNLGVAYTTMRRFDDAIEIFDKTVPIIPTNLSAPILHSFALAHHLSHHYTEAMKLYDRSLSLSPNITPVMSDRGLCLLAQPVKFNYGLGEYECRWSMLAKSKIWDLDIPEWKGEDLNNKSILIHHEQGLGDTIQFCRFINDLFSLGAEVSIAVPEELVELMKLAFPKAKLICHWDALDQFKTQKFDFHSPMMSVMRHLKIEIPKISSEPYLNANVWDGRLKLPKGYRIGICWQSGRHSPEMETRRRVIPLPWFLPMSEIPGVKLVSLQKLAPPGPGQMHATRDEIVEYGMEGIVFDCMARMENFADTAALMKELDLVISVDSSIIHLAGGLGIPSVMLSPNPRCWRWWNANEEGGWNGEPWYKDMKIFQQSKDGNWYDSVQQTIDFVSNIMKEEP